MALRTLYLHASWNTAGRNALGGGKLCEGFRARSDRLLAGNCVLPLDPEHRAERATPPQIVLCPEQVRGFGPNLIYIEGGLFADKTGTWKIPWPLVEGLVESGGVLIVADCGMRELRRHEPQYQRAARFLRARAEIAPDAPGPDANCSEVSEENREFICDTERMIISPWLRPAISGIRHVAVREPARLGSWEAIAASRSVQGSVSGHIGNHGERWEQGPWIFASVAQCGFGFVVFIAGEVSADDWIDRFPSNVAWLTNLADLLVGKAERNKFQAVCPAPSPFGLFLSHRSVNKQLAVRVGEALRSLGAEVRFDASHSVPADSLIQETSRGLEKMRHFVLFWSRACLGAPWVERELATAITMAVERRVHVLVVRLDMTPVPKVIGDSFRIEGVGMSPQELAESLMRGVRRLERNAV